MPVGFRHGAQKTPKPLAIADLGESVRASANTSVAEDTGLEPATGKPAIDFESTP